MKPLKYILFPFSLVYWTFTYCRNKCFDWNILRQQSFLIPIISVGNITVGGTGKTPHVQYIVNLLKDNEIASLSRGYKRKSKGYVLANDSTSVEELGDEPFLLQKRFPSLHVAVCEKRVVGISKLQEQIPNLQAIILDDAFQHRYVKSKLQIVLVDYNRPLWRDAVFPMGYLREGSYALSRADVVVVTKCPATMDESETEVWRKKLKIQHQKLFFSTMEYGAVYENADKHTCEPSQFFTGRNVCLVTGIAQPQPLIDFVCSFGGAVCVKTYPDHYNYSQTDVAELSQLAARYTMVTTEKDVYKLAEILPHTQLFVVPIMPKFLCNGQSDFDSMVRDIVCFS